MRASTGRECPPLRARALARLRHRQPAADRACVCGAQASAIIAPSNIILLRGLGKNTKAHPIGSCSPRATNGRSSIVADRKGRSRRADATFTGARRGHHLRCDPTIPTAHSRTGALSRGRAFGARRRSAQLDDNIRPSHTRDDHHRHGKSYRSQIGYAAAAARARAEGHTQARQRISRCGIALRRLVMD
jgi:hypothetical protein